jgi:hypothetical protein
MIAARVAGRYDQLRSCFVNPSKILSVAAIGNSDPPSVRIEVLCSLCAEADVLAVNLNQPGDLSWLRRHDFYFVCARHRQLELS